MTKDQTNESGSPPIVEGKQAIRYVEARRVGTCAFADRIAALSIQHYKQHIDENIRTNILPQTCIATIVAAFHGSKIPSSSLELQVDEVAKPSIVTLKVLSMGVGTKFLSEQILKSEREVQYTNETNASTKGTVHMFPTLYGSRIRDCHAEVLCRRAFRKYLLDCIEILEKLQMSTSDECAPINRSGSYNTSILQKCMIPNINPVSSTGGDMECQERSLLYELRPDVTLHMYCSSTPCGNSTIKKFASLQKEVYCATLSEDAWPSNQHNHLASPVVGHSIPLGQFALLVKKDNLQQTLQPTSAATSADHARVLSKKEKTWPIYNSTDWCPPGTTTVWSNQGSIHTCSDKMARWNYLGYQGSLLSTFLKEPLYVTTVTVGRKFSSMTCRRAICCRMDAHNQISKPGKLKKRAKIENVRNDDVETISTAVDHIEHPLIYQLHHPTVMGTSVYMDETGFINMSAVGQAESKHIETTGECMGIDDGSGRCTSPSAAAAMPNSCGEVRFLSPMSFVTWLQHPSFASGSKVRDSDYYMECIDGATGFLMNDTTTLDRDDNATQQSKVSTVALLKQFLLMKFMKLGTVTVVEQDWMQAQTLDEYQKLKRVVSLPYEQAKDTLLRKHPVFRNWKRHIIGGMDGTACVD